MINAYQELKSELLAKPRRWLVTGAAGFIGSNLVEELLDLGQTVVGLDNFMTGHRKNLDDIAASVGLEKARQFHFIDGDIRDVAVCHTACKGVDYVLHQAALGSVPRSIEEPLLTHEVNVTGFANMLLAARDARVKRFVYASSSAVYGDSPKLPKAEEDLGKMLSPYALSKYADELYADVFGRSYGIEHVGLRYFNVFGKRQDPEGAYAAVIPKWIDALIRNREIVIFGTGETTRDFCYVNNVVQANLLAATVPGAEALNRAYNVAYRARTSLNELLGLLKKLLATRFPHVLRGKVRHEAFREGDIMHSFANIEKAVTLLGYVPTHDVALGLKEALDWYVADLSRGA